jgi:hypothetical protein
MSGRLILSQKLTDVNVNQIPIVHWAESIYIVTVLNKNNGIVYKQEKIVKMK